MKRVYLFFYFLVITTVSNSQSSSIPTNLPQITHEKDRWDLNQYVWSHTHYKNRETDKPVIDFDAIDNWQSLGTASVNPDGKYFAYIIDKGSGTNKKLDSLIIQSTENSWRKAFSYNAKPGFFSVNNNQYIFLNKEILYFLFLGKDKITKINGTISYKVPSNGKNEWLAYQKRIQDTTLVLQDLKTGKEKQFTGEYSYAFDRSVSWLVLQKNKAQSLELYNLRNGIDLKFSSVIAYQIDANGKNIIVKDNKEELLFTELNPVKPTVIWTPVNLKQKIIDFKEDANGSQVVFTVEDENKQISIWHWKNGMEKAIEKMNNNTKGIYDMVLQPTASFTDNGKYIQFSLKPKSDQRKPLEDAVQLDIFSYKDTIFHANQYQSKEISYTAVLNLETEMTILLENNYEILNQLKGDFAIVSKKGSTVLGDRFWEEDYSKDSNWIVSLKDGNRRLIPASDSRFGWFSPNGKYWVYYEPAKDCHYFSYNFQTGEVKNISMNVPSGILGFRDLYVHNDKKPLGARLAAWLLEDKGLLVYDNYDIWKLDLAGKTPAINLTNGYGRKNNIVLGLLDQQRGISGLPVKEEEVFVLTAFNLKNKYNGFYRAAMNKAQDPELVFMAPCFIQTPGAVFGAVHGKGKPTVKALNSNIWIIQKETAIDAPNYYLTKNFKEFKKLTHLEPQKKYNWLTSELITFQQLDSSLSQAVLFKPENFDSTRRYPVIVSFYSALSDRLYQYLEPAYINRPNIFDSPSWLVSHGFLVVTPDIYFTDGSWGPSTINTIEGVVKFLKHLSYVDTNHLGATGHSNSGRFGHYLLTHSTSFSAMAIGAGATNLISVALSRYEDGESFLNWAEVNAVGTGLGELWKNKASWLDQTSVLNADKVNTPLLMFHNKNDGAFLPGGALDMFTALRRLQKRVWWLQYDEGGHTLFKLRDQRDFTIRYTQFFDHYLKGAPMPYWMDQGISNKLRGIKSGYSLKK